MFKLWKGEGKRAWWAQAKQKRRRHENQTSEAHQPKSREEAFYELQKYFFKLTVVESCKTPKADSDKDRKETVTVFVKTINGKTIKNQV